MAKKAQFVIKYKYPSGPWNEWARTQVPAMVLHYEEGCSKDYPDAEVKVFKEV